MRREVWNRTILTFLGGKREGGKEGERERDLALCAIVRTTIYELYNTDTVQYDSKSAYNTTEHDNMEEVRYVRCLEG